MSAKNSLTGCAGLCSPARSRVHVYMATSQGIGMQASQTTQNQNEAVKAILFDMVMLFSVPQQQHIHQRSIAHVQHHTRRACMLF